VHDAADHAAIINPMRTPSTARQQWLKPIPLAIAEPIKLLPHQGLLRIGSLESQLKPRWNPY
jgi:hypothetical protein